jgi:hypothetical protein
MESKGFKTISKLLIVIALLVLSSASDHAENTKSNYAITVGMDRRIYIVDLNTLKVIKKSEPFMEIGRPTSIDYDKIRGRLYVASERGYLWEVNSRGRTPQVAYYPLTVFEIGAESIKLVDKYKLEEGEPLGEFETVWAIYEIKLSPDGRKIFAGYAHPKYHWSNPAYGGGSAVVDASTGNIIGVLSFRIRQLNSIFSADGKKMCMIYPPGSRIIKKDGEEKIKKWKGYVVTYDIEKNQKIEKIEAEDLIRSKRGFNPLWGKIDTPIVKIPFESDGTGWRRLKIYDRMSGEEISEIDLKEISGGLTPSRDYVLFLPGGKHKVILPMVGKSGRYLVIIDLKEKKIEAKIEIDAVPSNIILTDTLFKRK